MRENEEQMDSGSSGRMRGQGHVRIPQRRTAQSLRSGVSPSMSVMQNSGSGRFQGGGNPPHQAFPIRAQGPSRSGMFRSFMQRAGVGNGRPPMPSQRVPEPTHFPHPPNRFPTPQPKPPMFGGGPRGIRNPGHQNFPGGGPPHHTPPIIGHGQTLPAMLQAMMGDIGQGFSQDQFANMQGGHMPGQENGDFWNAIGTANLSGGQDPMQMLAQYLMQGQDGTYSMDPTHQQDVMGLLRQAIHARYPQPAPRPPQPPAPRPMSGRPPMNGRPPMFANPGQMPLMPWMQ